MVWPLIFCGPEIDDVSRPNAIDAAQEALLSTGLINLVVIDAAGVILAAKGNLVEDWESGERVFDRLMVLVGMEDMIASMAQEDSSVAPLELPAVFLGGNHEDGDAGLSLRLSPLGPGQALVVLRPLDAAGTGEQRTVQQHNDLALLRDQLDQAQSQAENNITTREHLFDSLKWGFRAPLAVLVQALDTQKDLQPLAMDALSAVDDWLDLLALKTAMDDQPEKGGAVMALASVFAALREEFADDLSFRVNDSDVKQARLTGSSTVLQTGLRSLLRAGQGSLALSFSLEDGGACWRLDGINNGDRLTSDYRWELARTAAVLLGGSLTLADQTARFRLPLAPSA